MSAVFSTVLSLFLLIGVGAVAQIIIKHKKIREGDLICKLGIRCETWSETLNKFVLYLALPALIFSSLLNADKTQLLGGAGVLLNLAIPAGIILLVVAAARLLKISREITNAYIFCAFFGNIAYIGFPFLSDTVPNSAGALSVIIALHVLVAFTLGLFFLEHSKSKDNGFSAIAKNIVKSPLLHAIALGLLFLFLGIPLPATIKDAIHTLGAAASPVVLIALGMFMVENVRMDRTMAHAALLTGIKNIGMPLLFIGGALLFGIEASQDSALSIMEASMPIALTNFAIAEIYPMHKRVVANSIILSTVVSLFTISLFAAFVL